MNSVNTGPLHISYIFAIRFGDLDQEIDITVSDDSENKVNTFVNNRAEKQNIKSKQVNRGRHSTISLPSWRSLGTAPGT